MGKGSLALCAIAYCYLYNHSERINNPNEMARVHTVVALAEHGTYVIARRDAAQRDGGPVYERLGVVRDRAIVCDDPRAQPPACAGRLYAAKAPGLSWLGVPVYWIFAGVRKLFGLGPPTLAATVWALRFFCVILPTLVAWWWLARHLASRLRQPRIAVAVTLALALGSLSLTYGQMFAGHQPAGLALLASFGCLEQLRTRRSLLLAGGFAALAAAIEYPAAGGSVLLAGWLLVSRKNARDLGWFVLGALAPLALLAHFHTVAFGAPWRLPYRFLEDPGFAAAQSGRLFGIAAPSSESVWGSLFSPETGLHFWAPWTILIWLGVGTFRRGAPPAARLAFLVCLYFLAVQFGYSVWRGGWVVGPRHLTAMMPFAAVAVAHLLDGAGERTQRAWLFTFSALAGAAIVVTGVASAVSQGFPEDFHNPLREAVVPLLSCGYVAANPLMALGTPGPWSALPYFAALGAGGVVVSWLCVQNESRRVLAALASLAAAAVIAVLLFRVGPGPTPNTHQQVLRLMRDWSPPRPPGSCDPDAAQRTQAHSGPNRRVAVHCRLDGSGT